MSDIDLFDSILSHMRETYIKKNHDYGNSFAETYRAFGDKGLVTAAAQISHKNHRLVNLAKGANNLVGESVEDTLLDMATYCVLTLIERAKEREVHRTRI